LQEAEDAGRVIEAGVARRGLALISYFLGDFIAARTHGERALDACDLTRDQETLARFGDDIGTVTMSCLAVTCWQLGEVERARELIDRATRRSAELNHAPSMATTLGWKSNLEVIRGDAPAALVAAEALKALSREHGMAHWRAVAELTTGWAHGRLHDPSGGAAELTKAVATLAGQGARLQRNVSEALLAEIEVETLGVESALARIDGVLTDAAQAESRSDLTFIHRLRGNILLKRDPPDLSSAEDAYRTAIATAKEQGARSYELLASLSLAKLYQSMDRRADARAVLAPALEGFSPTPEMPEIAEAQALLERLGHRGDGAIPAKDPATGG
jgi:tetratricopeptide (TPR) repeat protein